MGEKIRDLKEITIGNTKLMVELNHGYTKEQGDVIHIQNRNFRYLFNLKDFLHTVAEVLRSGKELDYIKSHPAIKKSNLSANTGLFLERNPKNDSFLKLIDSKKIDYRFIEECGHLKTIIVNPADRKNLQQLLDLGKDFKRLKHPYSSFFGYKYLYQMNEFDLVKYGNNYCEIYYQLPCCSLTVKNWIPLDNLIQKAIWSDNKRVLDDRIYYIYRLCWAVFKDQAFSANSVNALRKNQYVLTDEHIKDYLRPVFFGFTGTLLEMLRNEKFDEIVHSYLTYSDY